MKYIVNVSGGGIFSLMHQFFEVVIGNINDIDSISSLRIIIPNNPFIKDKFIFDNIFEISDDDNNKNIIKIFLPSPKNSFLYANLYERFEDLKKINKKLKYNKLIIDEVEQYTKKNNIDNNTLGIHIRLTDMNSIHPEYGIFSLETFINETINYLNNNKHISKLFIASDNNESIEEFIKIFPNLTIYYYENKYRVNNIQDNNYHNQINNLNDKNFIINNFIENIILSKCCGLIHRISDFANYAIINSETFKDIIFLKK
jgi:hypothetical protein